MHSPSNANDRRLGWRWVKPSLPLHCNHAAIACQDLDFWMLGQPGLNRRDLAIGQQRDDPPPLKITDDGAVAVVASEGPIINANHSQSFRARPASASHDPKQSIIADRQHQPLGKVGPWPAAQRQSEMMNDTLQPRRSPAAHGDNAVIEAFGKDLPSAERSLAEKTSGQEAKLNPFASASEIVLT